MKICSLSGKSKSEFSRFWKCFIRYLHKYWYKKIVEASGNIYGSKKTFINHTDNAEIYSGDKLTDRIKDKSQYPGFEKGDLLPEFVKSIRNNQSHEVTGIDIFRVMDICFAIWEAYKKRKTIKVSYLIWYKI